MADLQKFYDNALQKGIIDKSVRYADFEKAMRDDKERESFYQYATDNGLQIGTPERFGEYVQTHLPQLEQTNPSVAENPAPTTEAEYQANLQRQWAEEQPPRQPIDFGNVQAPTMQIPTFGNDATRQDQTRLNDYETRVPEEVKEHNEMVARKMEERRPEHERLWSQDKPMIDEIYQQAEQDANAEFMRQAEAYSRIPFDANGSEISRAMAIQRAANEQRDPAKLINAFNARLDERMKERFPELKNTEPSSDKELAFQLGKTPEDYSLYKDYVMQQLQQYFTDVNMPKSQLEYFARKVIQGNIVGQLYEIGTKPLAQRQYEMQGLGQYAQQNETTGLDVAAEVTNVALYLPLMWATGGLGGAAERGLTRLTTRQLARQLERRGMREAEQMAARIMAQNAWYRAGMGAVREGTMFSTLNTINAIGSDLFQEGKLTSRVPIAGVEGFITGAAMGGIRVPNNKFTSYLQDQYGRRTGTLVGAANSLAARTNIMVGGQALGAVMNGEDMDKFDWGNAYLHAGLMNMGFDFLGAGKVYIHNRASSPDFHTAINRTINQLQSDPQAYIFSKEDIEKLNRAGVEGKDVREIVDNILNSQPQDIANSFGFNPENMRDVSRRTSEGFDTREIQNRLEQIFTNPDIDTEVKAKLYHIFTGQPLMAYALNTDARVQQEDGKYVVRTYDNAGMTYRTRTFDNLDDAEKYRQRQVAETRPRLLNWCENIAATSFRVQAQKQMTDEAVRQLAQEFNISEVEVRQQLKAALDNTMNGKPTEQTQAIADRYAELMEDIEQDMGKYTPIGNSDYIEAWREIIKGERKKGFRTLFTKTFAKDRGLLEENVHKILDSKYESLNDADRKIYDDYVQELQKRIRPTVYNAEWTNAQEYQEPRALNGTIPTDGGTPVEPEPLTPAQAERQRIMDEVTRDISEHTHSNGYLYPVTEPGNTDKAGFIVGDVVPVIDESNPEKLTISNNDVVTVKWSDDTVTQTAAKDLDLAGAPSLATDAINAEVERRMNEFTGQRVADGEPFVMLQDGQGNTQGFFLTDDPNTLVDENDNPFTVEQLTQDGWQAIEPDGQGGMVIKPITDAISSVQPASSGQSGQLQQDEAGSFNEVKGQQPIVEQPVAPVVQEPQEPDFDAMSAADYAAAAVEYMGSREYVDEFLDGEIKKVQQQLGVANRKKVGATTGMADFKAKKDAIEAEKNALQARLDKLNQAREKAKSYLTVAEREAMAKAEAERQAAAEAERLAAEQQAEQERLAAEEAARLAAEQQAAEEQRLAAEQQKEQPEAQVEQTLTEKPETTETPKEETPTIGILAGKDELKKLLTFKSPEEERFYDNICQSLKDDRKYPIAAPLEALATVRLYAERGEVEAEDANAAVQEIDQAIEEVKDMLGHNKIPADNYTKAWEKAMSIFEKYPAKKEPQEVQTKQENEDVFTNFRDLVAKENPEQDPQEYLHTLSDEEMNALEDTLNMMRGDEQQDQDLVKQMYDRVASEQGRRYDMKFLEQEIAARPEAKNEDLKRLYELDDAARRAAMSRSGEYAEKLHAVNEYINTLSFEQIEAMFAEALANEGMYGMPTVLRETYDALFKQLNNAEVFDALSKKQGTITGKANKPKINIKDWLAGKDDPRAVLTGVHNDPSGVGVATNAHILIATPQLYDKAQNGKTVTPDGTVIENAKFPNWQGVMDQARRSCTATATVNWEDVRNFIQGCKDKMKAEGNPFNKKNLARIVFRMPDGKVFGFRMNMFIPFAEAAATFDASELRYSPNQGQFFVEKDGNMALVMPLSGLGEERADELDTFFYDMQAEQAPAETPAEAPKQADKAPAAKKAAPAAEVVEQPKAKIGDVGEKIGGARKDIVQTTVDRINVNGETFSKIFPKFDYHKLIESGLEPRLAAGLKYVCEHAKKTYKMRKKRYGENNALEATRFLANYAKGYLLGDTSLDFTSNGWVFTDYGKRKYEFAISLWEELQRRMGDSMFDVDLTDYDGDIIPTEEERKAQAAEKGRKYTPSTNVYFRNVNGESTEFTPRYEIYTPHGTKLFTEEEREDAIKYFADNITQSVSYKAANPYQLAVYSKRDGSGYCIHAKIGGKWVEITPWGKEYGLQYRDDHRAELQALAQRKAEELKEQRKNEKPVAKVELRLMKNPETGEYGNRFVIKLDKEYVPVIDEYFKVADSYNYQKAHRDEIQAKAQEILDKYLEEKEANKGWKPELNIGGLRSRVGEDWRGGKDVTAEQFRDTFGFRGVEFGNYVTQKERQRLLNECYDALRDMAQLLGISPKALSLDGQLGFAIGARGGAGAKAHYEPEKNVINLTKKNGWGAVAHEWWHALDYYFGQREKGNPALASRFRPDIRAAVETKFKELMATMRDTDYLKRSMALDRKTGKTYYATATEMGARAFEDYITRQLIQQGRTNDFLSHHTSPEDWNGDMANYPYPIEGDAEQISNAIQSLFDTMDEKTSEATGNQVLYSYLSRKEQQMSIINGTNPMLDDVHTGIRSVDDIHTLEETLNDSKLLVTEPDWEEDDIKHAVESGEVTIYSSYPIENGVFVTPSRMMAEDYAGDGEVYYKTVPVDKVAWIASDEGQYADVDELSNIGTRLTEPEQLATDALLEVLQDNPSVNLHIATDEEAKAVLEYKDANNIAQVNKRFNEELQQQIAGTLPAGHVYSFGNPSAILQKAGIANLPIEMAASRLVDKSMQMEHPYSLEEVRDLPAAIQNPLAVFISATHVGDHVVLTELKHGNRSFVAALRVNKIRGKIQVGDIEVNSIRSVHYRTGLNIVNWINEKLGTYFAPDFEQRWLNPLVKELRPKPQYNSADVRAQLKNAAKVVKDFDISKFLDGKSEKNLQFVSPNVELSFSNASEEIFYSNAERAVEGIKQEKATPEQWRAMIEKAGGLKAGEDKWIGLSDWLAQQRPTVTPQGNETRSQFVERAAAENKRFTLSKQDLLDYIREHKIQIEEVPYAEGLSTDAEQKLDEFNAEFEELIFEGDEETGSIYTSDWVDYAWRAMVDRYGDDFESAFEIEGEGTGSRLTPTMDYYGNYSDVALYFLGEGESRPINGTRLQYTTDGLENKREIALVVPTIESWNQGDEIHFGDAGEGRAVAWVRFGDAHKIKYGENGEELADVLVIDEIQSKRHQEGREKGYGEIGKSWAQIVKDADDAEKAVIDFWDRMRDKYHLERKSEIIKVISEEDMAEADRLNEIANSTRQAFFASNKYAVPAAPFEKNWHELAMKRILRFAAENGYDKVAWTTGEQQAKRYDIGKVVDLIEFSDWIPADAKDNDYGVEYRKVVIHPRNQISMWYYVDRNGNLINQDEGDPNTLAELVGKDLARNIVGSSVGSQIGGEGLRIGGEGMRGFYDDMLPRFMQKYGKKWGVQVGEVTMPQLEDGYQTMHAIDINDAMRESVMEGQPMFMRTPKGVLYGWAVGNNVYLTKDGLNPRSPIHEYSHLWVESVKQHNSELYDNLKDLFSRENLPDMWKQLDKEEQYSDLSEDGKLSEIISRFSERGGKRMEEEAKRMMDDAKKKGKKAVANTASLIQRMKNALKRLWDWVGEHLFNIKNFGSREEAADRILYDMINKTDLQLDEDKGLNQGQIRFAITSTSGQNKNRSEVITEALVKQANNNYNIMQSALKKVTADLKGIRAAMRMQSDYDRKVVYALLNLYNTLLQENGVWAQYMPDTTRRIAAQIVHAIGKQNITEEVNTIMDHMVHAQAKAAQRQWDKLRQTPIDKINISGVVMQGKVALEGQHALKAMNDALQANLTIEQIEEQINQLMDMEDNATDESLKTQYKGQWIGLTIAAQHLERLQHLQKERQQLDLELQSARSNKALKPAARQQLVDNIKQAMRDNYIEQAEAYTRSTQDLSEYVNTQEGRAKDFIRRQDANRDKIRSYAQRDLEGLATNPNRNRTRGNVARSIWDAFASPIRDLQSLLRLTGLHAPDGEGYLYNHFMRNWMDGADKERTGIVAASKTLDEKIAELTHGKYKTWEEAARKIDDASHNMFGITMLNGVDGKDMPVEEEIPLNAGNALYIYAVNKMNDGRMKLNGMNITEEDVQALADKVREQFGQEILDVVDWVQSEFFSQLRNRYNPTHEALFGAPMDAIENYFPLRINANARQQNEDLSEPDTDAARLLAGTSTGAIKRRTRNSLPLDVRNADFFQEVIRHISQMERWNAFAQWNRDANILFSDINFRNRIKGMKGTIYGEGDKLYNYMKDAFRVAIGTYKPNADGFSKEILNAAKGVTSAKINFRVFTALKQIASFPAFFTYMQDGVFVGSYLRNWLKPHETMKWAKENLPNFEKRVSKRDMGDMRLMQRSTDWQWNKRILEWSSKYGMFFNVFFDTLTCATGARAVYDSHLADYMKKGYSEEDARNRARQDAEQAFNTSQQSSEGAFMSAVQQDRNLVTAALTVFRTSPIQYTRNFFYHTRNLLRKFKDGAKEEQIKFRMGQYQNDGLTEEQARKAAEKDYNKSIRQDIVGFVVYGALLNILWRIAGQMPYLLFGDDDDKKKEILKDATTGGAFVSAITGLLGGGIVESALDGNGSVADMFAPEMPFTQDIKRAGQYLSNDKYAEFASQALSVLMQSGTGFDPLTASDMVSRIVTTLDSEEELNAATQALRVSQALLSIPQSQYEQMLIDKVVSGETDEDAALEDYIRYQKIHTAPLTWFMRGEESDEKAEENAEERFNKLLTERDKIKNPEDYEE